MIQIDMEMPKNCKFCPLHDVNPDQCPIRTIYKDDYATSRFTDCPLYKIAEDTDTISRQAVIDALQDRYKLYSWDDGGAQKAEIGRIIREIHDMSSAQPEPCGDMVSRNAIVQKLNEMDRYVSTELRLCDTDKKFPQNEVFIVDDVYEEIVEQLPSAQPEVLACGEGELIAQPETKRCDTCRHEKSQWFNRCADCSDYELWEGKEE